MLAVNYRGDKKFEVLKLARQQIHCEEIQDYFLIILIRIT
jgi:hypothetical protein